MKLDVIIPTYNRAALLERTLKSFLQATPARALETRVTVVDNCSTDNTRETIERWQPQFGERLHYVFESEQGSSQARNAGIRATNGDLVGFVDDDEEVEANWLLVVERAFADDATDYIGGPYLPRFETNVPDWFPREYRGAIGWVETSDEIVAYGANFAGVLMSGNAVIRRKVLDRIGLFTVDLGRKGQQKLLSGEDRELYQRLQKAGARGFYRPDLQVKHFIPATRLTKEYLRRWTYWHAVSMGLLDKRRPEAVAYLLGVPRYFFGEAARGAVAKVRATFGQSESFARDFHGELALLHLIGFVHGKYLYRG